MFDKFWHFIVSCGGNANEENSEEIMHFSDECMKHWSNLYLWNGSNVTIRDLPTLSDNIVDVRLLTGKYRNFMVTTKTQFTENVGEYVSLKCRKTTDPIELKILLACSPRGEALFKELLQLFPKSAEIRLGTITEYV